MVFNKRKGKSFRASISYHLYLQMVICKKNGHIPFENRKQKLHWFQLQKNWALSKRETFKIIFLKFMKAHVLS